MQLFGRLDVNWPDHDKVIAVGLAGAGLHATAICIAKRTETDGVISRALLQRYGATPDLIDELVNVGLFDDVDGRRIAVHGWLDHNAAAEDYREHGRRGSHKRYHSGPYETCRRCHPTGSPTYPPTGGLQGARGGQLSTDDLPESTGPVDEPVDNGNGQVTSHRQGGQQGGYRGPGRGGMPETETETETETDQNPLPHVSRADSPTPATTEANDTFTAALHLLAAREILRHPAHTDSDKQRTAIVGSKRRLHATAAHKHLRAHPDATPQQLADHLEPPPDTRPAAVAQSPWANGGGEIARRADVHTEQETQALLTELTDTSRRADPDTVADVIAATRAHLAQPGTPDPE